MRDEDLDLIQVLERALAARNVERSLLELLPKTSFYLNTRHALDKYRKLGESGGWPRVSAGPEIQKGEKSKRVAELRRRLLASDDSADSGSGRSDVFDENLVKAVRHFQSRHGLEVSGDADEATLAALEIRIQERIGQIEINLDRWRWLPRNLGDPYILANIANFELGVFEHSKRVMSMKIVAGTLSWATPISTAG